MKEIYGLDKESLNNESCLEYFNWILNKGAKQECRMSWLLAHCDDGVTWGRLENGKWLLASEYFPDIAPVPSRHNIQQIRIFGRESEVLIWRSEGSFAGRKIKDVAFNAEKYLKPWCESQILLGTRLKETSSGFSLVADSTGAKADRS